MSEVGDDEVLFRRVLDTDNHVAIVDGKYKVTAQAFGDSAQKPSVDLASRCEKLGGAAWTQDGDENGVAVLVTEKVRALKIVGVKTLPLPLPPNTKKTVDVEHAIDVHPCPVRDDPHIRDNPAHAELRPSPEWCSKSAFRRLLEALERIASIAILPKSRR